MSQHDQLAACRNCEAALSGPYCARCGQKAEHMHKPFWEIAEDFLHSIVHFDGRLWRTLKSLYLRPGEMTADWVDGRQARYVPPIRLFVFTSLLLVILLSISDVVLLRPYVGPKLETARLRVEQTAEGSLVQFGKDEILFDVLNIEPEGPAPAKLIDASQLDAIKSNDELSTFFTRLTDGLNALAHNPHTANEVIGKSLSKFMLFAVPIMTLGLWLVYVRRQRFLAEHVVFALHAHTFFFINLLAVVCVVWITRGLVHGAWLLGLLWAAYSLHFLLALKRAYGQGWAKTLAKSAVVTGIYLFGLGALGIYLVVRTLIA